MSGKSIPTIRRIMVIRGKIQSDQLDQNASPRVSSLG